MTKGRIENLGSRLLSERQKRGMSRRFLASQVGVSPETLRRIENGLTKSPRAALMMRLSECLGLSAEFLLNGSDKESPVKRSDQPLALVRQVKSSTLEINLPYPIKFSLQDRLELARRLSVEFVIFHDRQINPANVEMRELNAAAKGGLNHEK
jgi:transcriptional regulator with XRE-family HTH domain